MKLSQLKQIIKEEIHKVLNEAFVNDKGELEDFNFENDLVVKYLPEYYQNEKRYKFFYCEKGPKREGIILLFRYLSYYEPSGRSIKNQRGDGNQ